MNRREFLKGLFAAADAPAIDQVCREYADALQKDVCPTLSVEEKQHAIEGAILEDWEGR